MDQFRRALRLLLFVSGMVAGLVATLLLYFTRFVARPPRQALWATPRQFGLDFDEVQFPARDGVRLSGWFVPALAGNQPPAPAIVLLHGWPWNRLGTVPDTLFDDLPGSSPIELLPVTKALHQAGYHVLMFDLRNHGQSAAAPPVTFGLREAEDLLGALDFLQGLPAVDGQRIGVIGFSMGANALLFALPRTAAIRAAVAVQPTTPAVFNRRYAAFLLGPLGGMLATCMAFGFRWLSGGLRLSAIDPLFALAAAGNTPVLFVQGKGDAWGSPDDVARMVAVTAGAVEPWFVPTAHRFDGYQYLIDHVDRAVAFFSEKLGD